MPQKTFLKCGMGERLRLTVQKISKQEVVNVESTEGIFSIYSERLKEKLRELWNADKANPQGPLIGKTLEIGRTREGYELYLASEKAESDNLPF